MISDKIIQAIGLIGILELVIDILKNNKDGLQK
jgi:hypothetical protein